MLNLHHLTNSRSQRVIWLLEELELTYTLVIHERDKRTRTAPESLYNIHALGKAPVLIDGDITIAETGAIFDYLLETYSEGKLAPAHNTPTRVQYLYWKNFAEASFMPYLAMTQVFARIKNNTSFLLKPIISLIVKQVNNQYLYKNLELEINLIEQHLSKNQWFAGIQFTAADILMGFMLDMLATRFVTETSHPHVCQFVLKIKNRPAYKRANIEGKWSDEAFNQYWGHLKN